MASGNHFTLVHRQWQDHEDASRSAQGLLQKIGARCQQIKGCMILNLAASILRSCDGACQGCVVLFSLAHHHLCMASLVSRRLTTGDFLHRNGNALRTPPAERAYPSTSSHAATTVCQLGGSSSRYICILSCQLLSIPACVLPLSTFAHAWCPSV